ncbi:MAG TPA: extracellular solute-binding protein [Chloroflexota bacterium]|nr:extracellular solute-binding protein [Chloroflexota bacterium]
MGALGAGCAPGAVPGGQAGGGAGAEVAPAGTPRKGTTIQWAVDSGPTRTPLREEQVQLFKAQFPDLSVEYVQGATGTEKLQALFAAGTPPDIFRQETAGMPYFASRGQLTGLDPYLRRDRYDLSDFFPAAWGLWSWKGRHLGVPFMGIRVAYYHRGLADSAAVRRPPATWKDPAWTFDAFLDACRKVSAGGSGRWGFDVGPDRRDWQPWVWNNGGDLFSPDGTKLLLEEPPAVEALQFLVDLIHRHRAAPVPGELQAQGGRRGAFQAGSLLLYHEPVNSIAANRRVPGLDWSVTGLPRGKARASSSSGGGVGWFLAGDSKSKDESWELLKHLASKESVRLEAVRGEAPPSRRSIAAEPAFVNPPEPPGADMKVVVEALEAIKVETALINGVEVDRALDEELAPVWRGERTLREAVSQAATRIRPLLNPPG